MDICGPSIPTMLGIASEQVHASSSGWSPVYVQDNLGVMSVGFMLPSARNAVMWRGPKKNGLIAQFLKDVDWDELDFLVIDTPPGTSDEHLSVVQYLKESGIDGAVLITTPQEVALQDVRREYDFCRKVGIRVLGLVENMSGFVCPGCKTESQIFKPTTGGAKKLAQDLGVELLGAIPLDPRIGKSADYGISFLDEYPDSPATAAYLSIIDRTSTVAASRLMQLMIICRDQGGPLTSLGQHSMASGDSMFHPDSIALRDSCDHVRSKATTMSAIEISGSIRAWMSCDRCNYGLVSRTINYAPATYR